MLKYSHVQSFIRKSGRFGLFLPLSNAVMTYFSSCLNEDFLRRLAKSRHDRIEVYLSGLLDLEEISVRRDSSVRESFPERLPVWYCWLQGVEQLPLIPRLCLDSLYKYAGEHPVRIVTLDNFQDYVDLPELILDRYDSGDITHALFSDILRSALLYQQGGLWMDSTLLLTRELPSYVFDQPFFTIKTQETGNFVSRCRWTGFCLGGWKHNLLGQILCESFNEYFKKERYSMDYFLLDHFINHICEHNAQAEKMIDDVPFNNPNVHQLNGLLSREYDDALFSSLSTGTFLSKLSWKTYRESELLSNPNNFYCYLRREIN